MDHSTPTTPHNLPILDTVGKAQLDQMEKNCADFGIRLYNLSSDKARHRPRNGTRTRPDTARHDDSLWRQPYRHPRSLRCTSVRHRHQPSRPSPGDAVPPPAALEILCDPSRRQTPARRNRERHHPSRDRENRHRRRHRVRVRIHRLHHTLFVHGRAHDHLQYVDRRRRARRSDRARRDYLPVHRRARICAERQSLGRSSSPLAATPHRRRRHLRE